LTPTARQQNIGSHQGRQKMDHALNLITPPEPHPNRPACAGGRIQV